MYKAIHIRIHTHPMYMICTCLMYKSMYNTDMNTLKVSEFRTQLKQSLDAAQAGKTVEIEREGTTFVLSLKGKEQKVPWLDLEKRIDDLRLLLEGMGTPTAQNPKIAPPTADFKKLGITTADKLETYEPIE